MSLTLTEIYFIMLSLIYTYINFRSDSLVISLVIRRYLE